MNATLATLLSRYQLTSPAQYAFALRETVQTIVLIGLWRSGFFERASFCGGTALRIMHSLPRYSEDMDFSLLRPDPAFSVEAYTKSLRDELQSFGFTASVERKRKGPERRVESAFVKANTLQSMLVIEAPPSITERMHRDQRLKIKVEVDTDPPPFGESEVRSLFSPIPFQVRISTPPTLFAGKMHALLCRSWKSRLKGRDFYDFTWFIGMGIPCDVRHLAARMTQSGHLPGGATLDRNALRGLLRKRFAEVDLKAAADDVLPFVDDKQSVALWSEEFFEEAADRIKITGEMPSDAAPAA